MSQKLRVGILRETKNPPDKRVPVTPSQVVKLTERFPNVDVFIQPSDIRCYTDEEYQTKPQGMPQRLGYFGSKGVSTQRDHHD